MTTESKPAEPERVCGNCRFYRGSPSEFAGKCTIGESLPPVLRHDAPLVCRVTERFTCVLFRARKES